MFHQVCLAPGHRHGLLRALIRLWLAHPLAGRSRSKKCPEIFAVPRPWPYFLIFWGYVMPHSELEHVCSYNNMLREGMCVAWGCHVPTDTNKKNGQFFWQAHSRHGILRQYPMNLAPFEKSCEPLIKELLSQRSIPLPEKIQEAIFIALPRWLFPKHFSVVIYVIHKRFACNYSCFVLRALADFWLPRHSTRTCCGYWHFLPLLLCSPPRWTCLVSVLIPTSVVEAFIMGTRVTVAQQDATKTSR